jgi:hypothetical protein
MSARMDKPGHAHKSVLREQVFPAMGAIAETKDRNDPVNVRALAHADQTFLAARPSVVR